MNSMHQDDYVYTQYVTMAARESAHVSKLGFQIDLTYILDQTEQTLEHIVNTVFEAITTRCRSQDPKSMIHELYDIWCNCFFFVSDSGERVDQSFPKSPNEIIARSIACIDGYKLIYTRLYQFYDQRHVKTVPEKQMILRKCHELVGRMHLVCRAFACFAQATTLGYDAQVSLEKVAHEYSVRMPFLIGLDLPIDYNVPGRHLMGVYNPITEPYQYLMRYVLTQIEQNRYRVHGQMLYMQHILPDDTKPTGFVYTRFWKPYMDLTKYIYQGIMPTYQEHVFRALVSIRNQGVQSIVDQIASSNFVARIQPNYRYRSFRNGLYQIEVDRVQEPGLAWNDPAVLNGRFLSYDNPACPTDIASEIFFDTDFNPAWLEMPVQDIGTLNLDTLLGTQNIRLDQCLERPSDILDAEGRGLFNSLWSFGSSENERDALGRLSFLSSLVGDLMPLGQEKMDWKYDMGFVYAMALFLCGRCLRPLQTKVFDHTGERYNMNDNYQCAPFFMGMPGTGKSTLLNLLSRMYHRTSVHEIKCNSDSQFGLGPLTDENIKFVYMSETARQMPWSVSVLNTMVEGGNTELRVMRKDPVVKLTTFTMAFAANPDQVPIEWIKDPRQGFRRRLAVFQFMNSPEKSDSELLNRLMKDDELAKMLVKFNRMYLIGRAYFDALRMARGTFNFMQYMTEHMYFSRARAELFAQASPADAFLSQENDAMLELDPSLNKAFLLQDVMKAMRDFCAQRQVPAARVPQMPAMILTLQNTQCRVMEGSLSPDEEATLPQDMRGESSRKKKRYQFVFGLVLKGGTYKEYKPVDLVLSKTTAQVRYETKRSRDERAARPGASDPESARAVQTLLSSLDDEVERQMLEFLGEV